MVWVKCIVGESEPFPHQWDVPLVHICRYYPGRVIGCIEADPEQEGVSMHTRSRFEGWLVSIA